jgi:hypothetical protein
MDMLNIRDNPSTGGCFLCLEPIIEDNAEDDREHYRSRYPKPRKDELPKIEEPPVEVLETPEG